MLIRMTEAQAAGNVPSWGLADRLRKSLDEAGISNQEMAEYFGVSRNTISRLINGHSPPDLRTLRLWALRTGAPFEWLVDGGPRSVSCEELAVALEVATETVEAHGLSREQALAALGPVRALLLAGPDDHPSTSGLSRRELVTGRFGPAGVARLPRSARAA